MAQVAAPLVTLATAVASPAGTVTVPYPAGRVQADFTGINASGTAYLLLNDNDRFEEADDDFEIAYGGSNVTVTNKTGATWPIGTTLRVGLAFADPAGNIDNLALTPLDTSDTYTDEAANAQFTAVQTKLNAVLQALRSTGVIAAS